MLRIFVFLLISVAISPCHSFVSILFSVSVLLNFQKSPVCVAIFLVRGNSKLFRRRIVLLLFLLFSYTVAFPRKRSFSPRNERFLKQQYAPRAHLKCNSLRTRAPRLESNSFRVRAPREKPCIPARVIVYFYGM